MTFERKKNAHLWRHQGATFVRLILRLFGCQNNPIDVGFGKFDINLINRKDDKSIPPECQRGLTNNN